MIYNTQQVIVRAQEASTSMYFVEEGRCKGKVVGGVGGGGAHTGSAAGTPGTGSGPRAAAGKNGSTAAAVDSIGDSVSPDRVSDAEWCLRASTLLSNANLVVSYRDAGTPSLSPSPPPPPLCLPSVTN